MFSKELELSISQAYQSARESRHEFLTVEHMLLALRSGAWEEGPARQNAWG